MASVFDAARYIREKTGRISTLKLQKLCYYAQAWSLVWEEEELFPEDFQAWANGPVCPELFNWHQGEFKVSAEDVPKKKLTEHPFTKAQLDTLDIVIRDYGCDTGPQLSQLSHKEAPWKDARGGLAPGMKSQNVITKQSMSWYYAAL